MAIEVYQPYVFGRLGDGALGGPPSFGAPQAVSICAPTDLRVSPSSMTTKPVVSIDQQLDDLINEGLKSSPRAIDRLDPVVKWLQAKLGLEGKVARPKVVADVNGDLRNRLGELIARDDYPFWVILLELDHERLENDEAYKQKELDAASLVLQEFIERDLAIGPGLIFTSDGSTPKHWTLERVEQPSNSRIDLAPLLSVYPGCEPRTWIAGARRRRGGVASSPRTPPSSPLVLDERTRRMVRSAFASSQAIVLVGPPGTGKTTLLRRAYEEAQAHPEVFGLSDVPREPMWTTPEESWTADKLIGGETMIGGELRFSPGLVLQAINEHRWLVLDEANRGDMDKIFGPLLTWLSTDQEVEIGRLAPAPNAPRILLGWSTDVKSEVENWELFDAPPEKWRGDIRFLAGRDWRLLGTYNPLDAHRVFRFGQALGRRFSRVPIPAISIELFAGVVKGRADGMPVKVATSILGLYSAHHDESDEDYRTALGPAVFLEMAKYVKAAASLSNGTLDDAILEELLAEAYVLAAGTWLAKLDPQELSRLGKRIVEDRKVLSDPQWRWVLKQLPTLG